MEKSKVYFCPVITPENVLKLYNALGVTLPGKVAAKVHSGEEGNQNYLHPEFWKPIIDHVGGTVVECNTAYEGERNYTDKHLKLLEGHGWSKLFPVDLLDAEGPDLALPVKGGKLLKENLVGKNLANYNSLLVLSHFKGHPMAGLGGALKNMSIGVASAHGKQWIHTSGSGETSFKALMNADHDGFLESMADADQSVMAYMGTKNIVYINVANRLSVDCDCCAAPADPEMMDIGIFASLDPVAVDQACVDAVYSSKDPGKAALIERMESRNGILTVEAAAQLGIGTREYALISLS